MRTTKELLGSRIKELRKSKGLSQNELSEKVGIDSKHLSRIEVGRGYPSLDTLDKAAKALDVEIRDFFEFVQPTTSRDLRASINALLKGSDADQLKLVYKVVKAIVL
jgi:transcriptional regulator with XRE-family HTH domain